MGWSVRAKILAESWSVALIPSVLADKLRQEAPAIGGRSGAGNDLSQGSKDWVGPWPYRKEK